MQNMRRYGTKDADVGLQDVIVDVLESSLETRTRLFDRFVLSNGVLHLLLLLLLLGIRILEVLLHTLRQISQAKAILVNQTFLWLSILDLQLLLLLLVRYVRRVLLLRG